MSERNYSSAPALVDGNRMGDIGVHEATSTRESVLSVLASSLSLPDGKRSLEAMDAIVSGAVKHCGQNLLREGTHDLTHLSPSLAGYLRSVIENLSGSGYWKPACGQVIQCVHEKNKQYPVEILANLGIAIMTTGQSGCWELPLDGKSQLRLGNWLFSGCRHVKALSKNRDLIRLLIWLDDASQLTLDLELDEGKRVLKKGQEAFSATSVHGMDIVTDPSLLDIQYASLKHALADRELVARTPEVLNDAVELIAEYSPRYLGWVQATINAVIPLSLRSGHIAGGSSIYDFGCIHLSMDMERLRLAEQLVHEASHQWLSVASLLGALTDGTDERLYYSPIRNCDRPIHFILIAYHAMANVYKFYLDCRERGYPASVSFFSHKIRDLQVQLDALDKALEATKSLTTVGRALWHPLKEQIDLSTIEH